MVKSRKPGPSASSVTTRFTWKMWLIKGDEGHGVQQSCESMQPFRKFPFKLSFKNRKEKEKEKEKMLNVSFPKRSHNHSSWKVLKWRCNTKCQFIYSGDPPKTVTWLNEGVEAIGIILPAPHKFRGRVAPFPAQKLFCCFLKH